MSNLRSPHQVLSERLARMDKWVAMRAPWVFIDKEMELIREAFEAVSREQVVQRLAEIEAQKERTDAQFEQFKQKLLR